MDQGGRYLGLCLDVYWANANDLAPIRKELHSEMGRPGFPVTLLDEDTVAVRWARQVATAECLDVPLRGTPSVCQSSPALNSNADN
ncbi:hypothetical protein SB11R_06010 [Pseudomonas oryzihabitans]|nr:hypothetical protein NS376_20980 [Pseudomonas psychrotolerans]KTT51124.1 hypothetical protein SB11R_06010 [Pseudomonas psychrotolerans]